MELMLKVDCSLNFLVIFFFSLFDSDESWEKQDEPLEVWLGHMLFLNAHCADMWQTLNVS